MRTIRFRGMYNVRDRKNLKVMAYGQLDVRPNLDVRITTYGKTRKGEAYRRSFFVDFRTVGQLTDSKDSNSNELYEGDICWNPHDETWGEVIWDEGGWCYQWDNIVENLHDCSYQLEVVGNVHENPELLVKA